jgi:flavin reductase (DIM6/NTAB) family NADH-FMN oxidoreductase RutF
VAPKPGKGVYQATFELRGFGCFPSLNEVTNLLPSFRLKRDRMPELQFRTIEPKILYFGTPVALISSLNEDGTTNLAPTSSFWALGWTIMLGLLDETKTAENLARHPECVINLPAPGMWREVEKLAPLTGKNPVPQIKAKQFRFEKDKFAIAGLTPIASELVRPARAEQCPVPWKHA